MDEKLLTMKKKKGSEKVRFIKLSKISFFLYLIKFKLTSIIRWKKKKKLKNNKNKKTLILLS